MCILGLSSIDKFVVIARIKTTAKPTSTSLSTTLKQCHPTAALKFRNVNGTVIILVIKIQD